MTTRNFGAPITRNEDARLLSGQALFVDDVELPGMLHAAFLRSNVAHARLARSMSRRRAHGRAWLRSIPPRISAITGRRDRCWCRRRRSQGSFSISARRFRWPRTKCVTSASLWPSSWRESRYLAEDALADIVVELDPLPAVVDLEKALTEGSTHGARRCAQQHCRTCPPKPRQLRCRPRPRRPRHRPPLSATITAHRHRSKRAASSPIGTAAPISSRFGTRPRRRSFCATGLPECWA